MPPGPLPAVTSQRPDTRKLTVAEGKHAQLVAALVRRQHAPLAVKHHRGRMRRSLAADAVPNRSPSESPSLSPTARPLRVTARCMRHRHAPQPLRCVRLGQPPGPAGRCQRAITAPGSSTASRPVVASIVYASTLPRGRLPYSDTPLATYSFPWPIAIATGRALEIVCRLRKRSLRRDRVHMDRILGLRCRQTRLHRPPSPTGRRRRSIRRRYPPSVKNVCDPLRSSPLSSRLEST